VLGEITGIKTSIFENKWPELQPVLLDKESWQKMLLIQGIVTEIRAVRATFNVPAKTKVDVVVRCSDEKQPSAVLDNTETVRFLANVDKVNAGKKISRPAGSAAAVLGSVEIFIPLGSILSLDKERVRLSKKSEQLDKELLGVHTKLMNQDFVSRAKPEVVEKVRQREELIIKEKERLERLICGLTDV
jgi:valyl-tRNA synthetase